MSEVVLDAVTMPAVGEAPALKPVMFKVIYGLEQCDRPERLKHEKLQCDSAKHGMQASRHAGRRQKVHWDFVVPPRKSLLAQPGALYFAGRAKLPDDDTRQEEVKIFTVPRRGRVLVGADVLVVA